MPSGFYLGLKVLNSSNTQNSYYYNGLLVLSCVDFGGLSEYQKQLALELNGMAAPTVEAHQSVKGPDIRRNSGERR